MFISGKVKSIAIKENRAGIDILTCIVEIRKNQNVTAEWINPVGEAATPVIGEWVLAVPREQTIGGWLAMGFVDVINKIFAAGGVKILFGRDAEGVIQTKIVLGDESIIFNDGSGTATETKRLQEDLDNFSAVVLAEFNKVAAGTEPNPAAPYVPSEELPVDVESARSENIRIP